MARNTIFKVLSTPELVALILSHLSPTELLLTAPLVSPTFHLTILSTPSIQETLFFRPSLDISKPIELNPFLESAFPTHFQPSHRYCSSPDIRKLPWSKKPAAFKRKEASWRNMLLWNGGVESAKRVKIVSQVQQMSGTYGSAGYLEAEEGVRMGVVWDLTRGACETEEKGQFCLKWRDDALISKGNVQIDVPIMTGHYRLTILGRVRNLIRFREHSSDIRPIQTRYVQLGNRVEKEEKDVLEICLSTWMSCEWRNIFDPPPMGLGEEFQSQGREKVAVEFEEAVRMTDSAALMASAGAFRAQARNKRRVYW